VSCDGRRDAVLLFAAGLLEEPEAAELRGHLEGGCVACARHLCEARAVENALALAAGDEPLAPALRSELLRRIHRVPRLAVPSVRRARPRYVPLALAAGLAAAVAAPLGWLLAFERGEALVADRDAQLSELRAKQGELEQELASAREAEEELDGELAEVEARSRALESDLKRAQRQVAMLAHPGLVTLDLSGTAQPAAHARVYWEWDDYYCYLQADGLGALEAPRVYALWLDTEKGDRILAGTFAPEDGKATLWVQLPRDMGRAVSAEVTLEPEAPGPSPVGPSQLRSAPRRS
jgi:hypothetical protein